MGQRTAAHLTTVTCSTKCTIRPTVAHSTGGANGDWIQAHELGLDAYLTGEMSEHDWNEAQEAGVHMFAGGHHATERFGVQSLMKNLEQTFSNKVETLYIESQNPA